MGAIGCFFLASGTLRAVYVRFAYSQQVHPHVQHSWPAGVGVPQSRELSYLYAQVT